jgi:hypothetical protein
MKETTWYWQSIHSGNSIVNWTLDDQEGREIQTGSRHKQNHTVRTCELVYRRSFYVYWSTFTWLLNYSQLTTLRYMIHPPLPSTFFLTQYNWMHARHAKLQEYLGRKHKKYVGGRGPYLSLEIIVQYFAFSEVWQMHSTLKNFCTFVADFFDPLSVWKVAEWLTKKTRLGGDPENRPSWK